MTFPDKTLALAAGAALALALGAGVAPVQAQQMQQQQAQPQGAAEVDDATLQAFAEASLDVSDAANEWTQRVQQAHGPEAEELRIQAYEEMVDVVESHGLEVETYNRIARLVQADPEVAADVAQKQQELQ